MNIFEFEHRRTDCIFALRLGENILGFCKPLKQQNNQQQQPTTAHKIIAKTPI